MQLRDINLIVIHCTATANGKPVALSTIEAEHRRRGFGGIGYHYITQPDGRVDLTRPEEVIGCHAKGYNLRSIGISLVGGIGRTDHLNPGSYTQAQWDSLKIAVEDLLGRYPKAKVCGHRDLSPDLDGDGQIEPQEWIKLCPCFEVFHWFGNGMEAPEGQIYHEVHHA